MQAEELAYVILTPYSMRKSRTGGIISRLISIPATVFDTRRKATRTFKQSLSCRVFFI